MQQKRFTTFLLIALIGTATATAQEGFRIGAKGLVQNTWMFNQDDSDNPVPAYITTFGGAGGLALGYHFSPTVGLCLDAIYSPQGQRYDIQQGAGELEQRQRLNYLKLPLLFELTSDPANGGTMFLFRIGPQFGLLMNAESEVEPTTFNGLPVPGLTVDNTDNYEKLNIGAVFSLGLAIPVADNVQITTSFRFDYAFTDAEDKDAPFWRAWDLANQGSRPITNNATGAFELGFNYLFVK